MKTFLQLHLLNNKNHILKGENHGNLYSRSSETVYSLEAEGLEFESAEMESIKAEAMYN